MKAKIIHNIALILLLCNSVNYIAESYSVNLGFEKNKVEQNDSEKEIEELDLDKKETVLHYKLLFSEEFTLSVCHQFIDGYTTLEHFEKIPTPPPEV